VKYAAKLEKKKQWERERKERKEAEIRKVEEERRKKSINPFSVSNP